MSESNLIPERQLAFSPLLAATIGLEEAVLLQHLQQVFDQQTPQVRRGYAWYRVERDFLQRTLPFWDLEALHRITRSLADKGVLLLDSPPLLSAPELVFAVNEPAQRAARPPPPRPRRSPGRRHGAARACCRRTGHPARTCCNCSASTTTYRASLPWTNSRISSVTGASGARPATPGKTASASMSSTSGGIDSNAKQRVSGQHPRRAGQRLAPQRGRHGNHGAIRRRPFVHRGGDSRIHPLLARTRRAPRELNSKFIQHIRIQWARYTSSLQHSTEPTRIDRDWQPAQDVYDILRMSHIDAEFARSLLPEFIVYWRTATRHTRRGTASFCST
ncbi:MAG: DnaT-like ssDNA-binding domain-containing protein [Halioglobus sp.]|nr:DnaT-like ssDNA-binding domain-containing protein [Halioglobus sp.]